LHPLILENHKNDKKSQKFNKNANNKYAIIIKNNEMPLLLLALL